MIYEMRTTNIKVRSLVEVERRFGEAYEKRKKYSELGAFWHTEIGEFNQIISVWPYQSIDERWRIRAAALKDNVWPPDIGEFVVSTQSDIMIPFSFSPELRPAKLGPYFELRTYTYATGTLPIIMENWEAGIGARLEFSPICALWYTEIGSLNKFVHIWPYNTLDQRQEVRKKVSAAGIWPPRGKPCKDWIAQDNKILMPAAFSPLQ